MTAPGCSLPGQRLFCLLPPQPAHAPARRPHCLIPFYIRHHFSAISVRDTASLSEVIQPDADPLTPSAQLVALPTATTAAVVPGVASNLLTAFDMTTTSDNDAAPTPNHSLIASLLPTIRPPAALAVPAAPARGSRERPRARRALAGSARVSVEGAGTGEHRHFPLKYLEQQQGKGARVLCV